MTLLKQNWNTDMAMAVLENKTVDAALWAEAVEWLLLYGPPEVKELLSQASSVATSKEFPELKPTGYSAEGSPLYDINQLAESLGISVEEATERLQEKEHDHQTKHLFSDAESVKMQ